jgi:RimJ/RimL family protein N-acetyltransferase
LTDGVISLARYAPSDAVTVMQWDADPDIQHWFDWPLTPPGDDPATHEARLAAAQRVIQSKSAAWDAGEEFAFVIHSVKTGEGLGWVALAPRGSGRGNVSYGVLPAHRRQSAATRSVLLVSRYAFDVLGWTRLEIQANADNIASRRVAVRAGFELEGVLRSYGAYEKYQPLLGRRFDWAIYGKLVSDG